MTLISIISFTIFILIIIFSFVKKADLFSPGRVFGLIWSLAIGLTDLKLSRLQHQWNSYEWMMLLIGIASFFLGTFVVYVINYHTKLVPLKNMRAYFSADIIYQKKFLMIILILFFVYITSFVAIYKIVGFLPVFHFKAGQSRMYWNVFGLGLTVHIATPLVLFIVEYIRLAKPKIILKSVLIGIIVITVLSYLTLLQRFNLIFAIVIVIAFLYYSSNFMKLRNVLMSISVLVGLMYSVLFLRISSFALGYMYTMAQMKFNFKYAIFTEPYMYFSMNLENFVRSVSRLQDHTFGYYTFHFILSITGIKKSVVDYLNFNDFPFLNSAYNTYTMFWEYFRDFGTIGLFLIPFFLGFIISAFYYKLRSKPGLTYLSLYTVMVFIMTISFFVNTLGLLHFVFNTSLIVLLTYIVQKKPQPNS